MFVKEILFLEGLFKERVWGGKKLKEMFFSNSSLNTVGEYWAVSGLKGESSVISQGSLKGYSLEKLWNDRREVFGDIEGKEFPLLIKVIDADKDLSIQVHPDESYAQKHSGAFSKTECWYILDCPEDSVIIYGHNAQTMDEFKGMIENGSWEMLLRKKKIKKGDFIYVPSGTVHALTSGVMVLEIQEPSDTTFRLYDYDRLENGVKRQLHIKEALEVTVIPHRDPADDTLGKGLYDYENRLGDVLVKNKYFTVEKVSVAGEKEFSQNRPFMFMYVIDGEGSIDGKPLKKNDFFILPFNYGSFSIKGNISLVIASSK